MSDTKNIFAPEVVDLLNQSQVGIQGSFATHPFTCPNRCDGIVLVAGVRNASKATHSEVGGDLGLLIATLDGWQCPHCSYRQDWFHGEMARPVQASDGHAHSIGWSRRELICRAEGVYDEYRQLYLAHKGLRQASDASKEVSERVLKVVPYMLASLNRRRLQLAGVQIDEMGVLTTSVSWVSVKDRRPTEGAFVRALVRADVLSITDPSQKGFGTGVWVEGHGRYLPVGGEITHWHDPLLTIAEPRELALAPA